MKKQIFYSVLLLCFFIKATSQETTVKNRPEYDDKPLHFGYTLGINTMDFTFKRNFTAKISEEDTINSLYADITSRSPGFQVGMVGDMRLGNYFNLRIQPGFIFGQRNIQFYKRPKDKEAVKDSAVATTKIESSMLDLPILLKYRSKRINNYRPYLLIGGSIRYDLASKSKFDNDKPEEILLLKPLDYYLEMGFGIDFYLQYFKLSTELKLSLGFRDVLNANPGDSNSDRNKYIGSLSSLTSNILMLSIHIE